MKKMHWQLLAGLAFIVFVILRVLLLWNTHEAYNYGFDEPPRINQAVYWFNHPNHVPGELVWLPLHHIILSIFFPFFTNKIFAARLITLCFSLFGALALYGWSKSLFNQKVAALSVLLLAFLPLHTELSVRALSEVPYLFFLLLAAWATTKLVANSRGKWLLIWLISIACLNFLRYEGWVWSALMGFYLLFHYKPKWKLIAAGVIGALPIGIYIFFSMAFRGVPFWGFAYNVNYVTNESGVTPWEGFTSLLTDNEIIFWLALFLIIALGVYGIWKKPERHFAYLLVSFFLLQIIMGFAGKIMFHPRFYLIGIVLLLPYAASAIIIAHQNIGFKLAVPVFIVFSGLYGFQQLYYSASKGNVPEGFYESTLQIQQSNNSGKVLYDVDTDRSGVWLLWANRNYANTYPVIHGGVPAELDAWLEEDYSWNVLERQLTSKIYDRIIARKEGYLYSLLQSPAYQDLSRNENFSLQSLWMKGEYQMWAINYKDSTDLKSIRLLVHLFQNQPESKAAVFKAFGAPHTKDLEQWIYLFALGFLEIDGTFYAMDEEQEKGLFGFLESDYPGFYFPEDAMGDEGLLQALKTWSNKHPNEVIKAAKEYEEDYKNWKSEGN